MTTNLQTPMIQARMHIPIPPGPSRTRHLEALADILTEMNAEWAVDLLQRGYDVPCCLACVRPRVRYKAPPMGIHCQNWWPAPAVLERRVANCLDASAFDAGVHRAHRWLSGEPGEEFVSLEATTSTDYHAVAYINGERIDSSQLLIEQADGCPSCGGHC